MDTGFCGNLGSVKKEYVKERIRDFRLRSKRSKLIQDKLAMFSKELHHQELPEKDEQFFSYFCYMKELDHLIEEAIRNL